MDERSQCGTWCTNQEKLAGLKILKPGILNKPVSPNSSHEPDTYDWRYLASAPLPVKTVPVERNGLRTSSPMQKVKAIRYLPF
jgi:hypothetical protein